MKLTVDALAAHLARELLPVYLVSGDEALLTGEAADAIRAKARAAGFTDRAVHFIERGTSWGDVRAESSNLSLFATRRLIELRMPSGKPGTSGGAVIRELIERRDTDTLILILTDRLDRDAQGADWVRAVEAHGAWLPVWSVDRARFPAWLTARARRAGLELEGEAAQLLADRTEGNLLAAHQEIERLRLVAGAGAGAGARRLDAAAVAASVADSARFDVFKLGEAAQSGDAARTLRILNGLAGEGAEPTLVLWALIRALRQGGGGGGARARALIERARRADRAIKGQLRANAWDELALLAAGLCGVDALPAA
jgi:DNA polymerase-3 subunit delta